MPEMSGVGFCRRKGGWVGGAYRAVRIAQLRLVEASAAFHDVAVVAFEFETLAGGRALEAGHPFREERVEARVLEDLGLELILLVRGEGGSDLDFVAAGAFDPARSQSLLGL